MTIVARRPDLIACAGLGALESFGEVLRRRRLERGRTVSELARAAGVSRYAIYRWEDGRREPSRPYRLALSSALGLSADDDHGWWSKEW